MIKTTHKIMKGRQKYKSFFKVEPLSHGNIPLPPTHTPRYMVHNLSCSGSLSPIPPYWFNISTKETPFIRVFP